MKNAYKSSSHSESPRARINYSFRPMNHKQSNSNAMLCWMDKITCTDNIDWDYYFVWKPNWLSLSLVQFAHVNHPHAYFNTCTYNTH